jgi:hypothetical protein
MREVPDRVREEGARIENCVAKAQPCRSSMTAAAVKISQKMYEQVSPRNADPSDLILRHPRLSMH